MPAGVYVLFGLSVGFAFGFLIAMSIIRSDPDER
jgi:hypothetical protein